LKLDLEAIEALKLEVNVRTIVRSILNTPKIKVKEKNISIIKEDKIHIEPFDTSREKMYFGI
jgi:hypothetical protein